jgi:hypothetical protein
MNPAVKKVLDLRLAQGEISQEEYTKTLALVSQDAGAGLEKSNVGRHIAIGGILAVAFASLVWLWVSNLESPTRVVKHFLNAAMAARQTDADALLATGLTGRDVLDYEVLSYSIKNASEDVVSVEVSFRGDPKSGRVLEKASWIVTSDGFRQKGEVRKVLRFKVAFRKIVAIY